MELAVIGVVKVLPVSFKLTVDPFDSRKSVRKDLDLLAATAACFAAIAASALIPAITALPLSTVPGCNFRGCSQRGVLFSTFFKGCRLRDADDNTSTDDKGPERESTVGRDIFHQLDFAT
jgi:hypothetical protein